MPRSRTTARVARTIDTGVDEAAGVMEQLAGLGVDMDDVGRTLEDQGVASFHESFAHVLRALEAKPRSWRAADSGLGKWRRPALKLWLSPPP